MQEGNGVGWAPSEVRGKFVGQCAVRMASSTGDVMHLARLIDTGIPATGEAMVDQHEPW